MNEVSLINKFGNHSYIDFEEVSTSKPFLQANTEEFTLTEIRNYHTIPCFAKDNEPLISHCDFMDIAAQVTGDIFNRETILSPSIRLSHPIKGRVPEAKNKAAKDLLEHEKTLYYERMAFVIEVPTISDTIDGNTLSLTIGGVKSYSLDNLNSKKGSDETFKVFIGFKNLVCTNLCVWSDGYKADLRVKSLEQLKNAIYSLIQQYNASLHIKRMKDFTNYNLSERRFVQLIGRCKLYNYLPAHIKAGISPLLFGDNQISAICKDYFKDESFCRNEAGNINLWKMYNLFTGANKSSYIDTFLDRSMNAFMFVDEIKNAMDGTQTSWFIK
ncbi:DUF3871 family protein [Chitinophaga niabensis]|uniref:DUF3871 family protein n=1 Tax=Chitinophaga niabensis TaxID=536979 RepID=A0A1N6ERF3_9BACT|nr:DUF3871 family protein [Chitinophaga niabensis]SIN85567.1 protein of unknown function [Chitinophaga niabensis]